MKTLLVATLALSVVWTSFDASAVVSSTPATVSEPVQLTVDTSVLPKLSARAYGVFDAATGELLFAHNADAQLPIASITKLFTAAAALRAAANPVTITATDIATEGRAGKLAAGETYTPHQLLFPLLLESSNDAAVALARVIDDPYSGDVSLADTSGLSAANQASVKSLAAEVQRLYHTTPHVFDITTLSQYVGEETTWINNSPVRQLPGYQGGKHGYTEAAGRTLTAIFQEASLAGHEIGYIILGSDDLTRDTATLRDAVAHSVRWQ